ncbi:MAG: Ran-specific GTPase-activating protein 30 [Sporothrix thermara]
MDEFLGRLGIQAVNYAMRCGIALTSTFAMQQCSRLLETVNNEPQYAELLSLQRVLDSKIKIVSPALDLIEFKSGRGNVFLGNAAELARTLHRDIVALGKRLEKAAEVEELAQNQLYKMASNKKKNGAEIVGIICDVKALIARIDGDIPLLQLAITASGESLSTALPASISPSRLLQARPTTPSQCQTVSTSNTTSDINTCPTPERPKSHTTQSPFGPVVTSLSLLEMLVRLTSLQQFQQTMHLSIPDHILAFFLEETSATGLKGEERWKAKRAAEQRMGFDPFTDTPSKAQSGNKATL